MKLRTRIVFDFKRAAQSHFRLNSNTVGLRSTFSAHVRARVKISGLFVAKNRRAVLDRANVRKYIVGRI